MGPVVALANEVRSEAHAAVLPASLHLRTPINLDSLVLIVESYSRQESTPVAHDTP